MDSTGLVIAIITVVCLVVDGVVLSRTIGPLRLARGGAVGGCLEIGRFLVVALISLIVIVAGIYLIAAPGFSDDARKWASGALGMVLGYWLRAASA